LSCTEETLSQLYEAQRKIATGQNVVKVVIDGEETSFGGGNVRLLASLIGQCETDLGLSDISNTFTFMTTSKGFGA